MKRRKAKPSTDTCQFIDPLALNYLSTLLLPALGEDKQLLQRVMDGLAAHYGTQQGLAAEHNRIAIAVRGTTEGIRALFVEYVAESKMVEALALVRARPDAIGAELFVEHVTAMVDHVLNSGCWVTLDLLWPLLPKDVRTEFGASLPLAWWMKGHRMSAVTVAQGSKVPFNEAMFFALSIGTEHPEWSELIVAKQLELHASGLDS